VQRDITVYEIYRFKYPIILMGHDNRDTIKYYWSTNELCYAYALFYSNVMKCDRFLHIMSYLLEENYENPTDRTSSDNDKWKIVRVSIT
jgi:hypothetical protein